MLSIEELSARVAREVAPEGEGDNVAAEAVRIAVGKPGSGHLAAAETIMLSAMIVQVCVIVVEVAKLINGFFERSRNDQLLLVLARLAEESGDASVTKDPTIAKVANAACRALAED